MEQKNSISTKQADSKIKRRVFLQQCIYLGAGVTIGSLCASCNKNCHSLKGADLESDDFSMMAYCTLKCNECNAYIATKNKDEKLKAEVAASWGMKPEDINCEGCKSERALFSCSLKKCAIEKDIITCAHCKDFSSCNDEQWSKYPQLRESAEKLREQLNM
jgi:hypothetical protein